MSDTYAGIEDLLSNESFLAWYFKTDPSAVRQWDEWIAAGAANRALSEEAVRCLDSLRWQERPLPPEQLTEAINRLLAGIRHEESPVRHPEGRERTQVRPVRYIRWVAAAAVLVAAVLYGIGSLRKETLHTSYGEVRSSRLPDGTEIIVSAATSVVYPKNWRDGEDREVWLKGEAFFHVSKTPLRSRFIVHTDHFDILVTGTKFNAVNRPDKDNILLEEGSVTLEAPGTASLTLQPGDFAAYREGRLIKEVVKSDSVLAWKEHKLIFDSTSVRQLVALIREYYGVTVQPADEATAGQTVSGMLSNDNLDVLLNALEATGDFTVIHDREKIIIKGTVIH